MDYEVYKWKTLIYFVIPEYRLPPLPWLPSLPDYIVLVNNIINMISRSRDARMLNIEQHLLPHGKHIPDLLFTLWRAQNAMLLGRAYHVPRRTVRHAAVAWGVARFLRQGNCACVDEGLVALGVDAAYFCENTHGLLGFSNELGVDLLEVVCGIVSFLLLPLVSILTLIVTLTTGNPRDSWQWHLRMDSGEQTSM